jgi:hypothetical protein
VPEDLVPDAVIPHQHLPPLRYRDMPEPVPWVKMVGPSIILAGLALGSGEFLIWPHITFKSGFVFYWACMLGVLTQFFVNMEIERWTLVTGESAITGFCRLSRHWAWVMLILTIVPFAWPGWATGAGTIVSWMLFGPVETVAADGSAEIGARYVTGFGIGGLLLVGAVLTAGPVVYNTVERIQTVLVGLILVLVVVLAILVVRPDAVVAMAKGTVNIGGMPDLRPTDEGGTGLTFMGLLGALAFAGAGGAINLGQSNYIKDKGYGMGRYIGRITSPITGQEEAISEVGYTFRHTPENMARWRQWWRAANLEHFVSFFLTCVVCLCLLALVAYSLLYDASGHLKPGMEQFGSGFTFIWGEATVLAARAVWLKWAFLICGVAILLTTELGVLDAVARVCADIVKTNYCPQSTQWSVSKLYFLLLWGEIGLGIIILANVLSEPRLLILLASALNGAVMFLYSLILLYMNNRIISRNLAMSPLRFVAIVWSCAFFGYFTMQALRLSVWPAIASAVGLSG